MGGALETPPRRRLLLAGSHGIERIPVGPDPRIERWFEPLHVRDAAGARSRISAQVEVGADVVVAPTWLTHRRALLAVAETRHARAWTAAAMAIGRDAIEEGLERREAGVQPGPARPLPLLAGTLPSVDDRPELETGHLLPRESANAREYIDQAGLLADAGPDLLLVEGQRSVAEVRLATEAAAATGLPVWLALSGLDLDALAPEAAVDLTQEFTTSMRVERVLLPPVRQHALPESVPGSGGIVRSAADVTAWLERDMDVIGLLDGATPSRLRPIRAAIDEVELADLERRRETEERWWRHVRRAAAMAPGGRAVWLRGRASSDAGHDRLPEGFVWLAPDPADEMGLPYGRFMFIVDPVGGPGSAARAERLLDAGGIAAVRGPVSPHEGARLRLIAMDDEAAPPLAILRREA